MGSTKNTKRADPWFKFYAFDWLDGTRHMTLEQRGAYIDCIALIMAYDKPIPDDDKWVSHHMHISPRKWRLIRELLIEGRKLIVTSSGLDNDRCIEERQRRDDRSTVARENASTRSRFDDESSSSRERTDDEPMTNQQLVANENTKKPKENNEADEQALAFCSETRARNIRIQIQKKKEEPPFTPPIAETAAKKMVPQKVRGTGLGQSEMLAALNPHQAHAQQNIWIENERIEVANGARAELLGLVGGDEVTLRLVLDQALPYIPISTTNAMELKRAVLAQVSRYALEQRNRDRRAKVNRVAASEPRPFSDPEALAYARSNPIEPRMD